MIFNFVKITNFKFTIVEKCSPTYLIFSIFLYESMNLVPRFERKSFFLQLEKLWQKKDWERKADKAAQIILKNYFRE